MEDIKFKNVFEIAAERARPPRKIPQEGELFKIITACGKTFEIHYGYYEEIDRYSKGGEPMPIYPNFIEDPLYTDEGIPFVTAMQPSCEHYKGKIYEDSTCYDCAFYQCCDELLGICNCPARRISEGAEE